VGGNSAEFRDFNEVFLFPLPENSASFFDEYVEAKHLNGRLAKQILKVFEQTRFCLESVNLTPTLYEN
jgi:hypothetical protein